MIEVGNDVTGAAFSACGKYRYLLWRVWDPLWGDCMPPRTLLVIGLNPSTADEVTNDPTIRRCIGFAKDMDYGRLVMANLFAWRSTDPKALKTLQDPVGPENDAAILKAHLDADRTVAAWGAGGALHARADRVLEALKQSGKPDVWCFGRTRAGHPRHPLYLPRASILRRLDVSRKQQWHSEGNDVGEEAVRELDWSSQADSRGDGERGSP